MVLQLRRTHEGIARIVKFLGGVFRMLQEVECRERGADSFRAIRFGEGNDSFGKRDRNDRIATFFCRLDGSHQERHRIGRNGVGRGKLRHRIGDHLRILFGKLQDTHERFIELNAVAVHFFDQECSLFRRGFGQRFLQSRSDLRRLAPRLRLIIRPTRVRARAPGVALPFAFLEMQAAKSGEDALAQRRLGGFAEA